MEIKEIKINSVPEYIEVIEKTIQDKDLTNCRTNFGNFVQKVNTFESEIKDFNKNNLKMNAEQKKYYKRRLLEIVQGFHEFSSTNFLDEGFSVFLKNYDFFYRGVYNGEKFNLLPGCFRAGKNGKEDKYYHYVKAKCPNDFHGKSHLDTLVTLQHYDCPTRLLDITSNPLVALYFACKNYGCSNCETAKYGYVYVFANRKSVYFGESRPPISAIVGHLSRQL